MPQMVLEFTPEFQERVNFWSGRQHEDPDIFLKKIIAERLEDMEDYEEAARVAAEIKAGRMKTYPLEEVEREMAELDVLEG